MRRTPLFLLESWFADARREAVYKRLETLGFPQDHARREITALKVFLEWWEEGGNEETSAYWVGSALDQARQNNKGILLYIEAARKGEVGMYDLDLPSLEIDWFLDDFKSDPDAARADLPGIIKRDTKTLKKWISQADAMFPDKAKGPGGSRLINMDPPRVTRKTFNAIGKTLATAQRHLAKIKAQDLIKGRRFLIGGEYTPLFDPGKVQVGGGYTKARGRLPYPGGKTFATRPGDIGIHAKNDPPEMLHVAIHELAHAYYYERISSQARKRWEQMNKLASGHATPYGGTNPSEDFAELFTFALLGRKSGRRAKFTYSRDAVNRFRSFLRDQGVKPPQMEQKQ